MHVAIVVPTRNRAELAEAAVRSVLDQGVDDVSVLVSENSTQAAERERLAAFVAALGDERATLVTPPDPLPMTEHWAWALERALGDARVTHVGYLPDRWVFRRGGPATLAALAARHPQQVVTYEHDEVLDHEAPVRLRQAEWSGRLLELDARHLLELAAGGEFPHALPRALNSLVPREVLEAVRDRFGSVFASTAPDYCFAFRCLSVVDAVLFYDAACAIHYALDRSHGFSQARGVDTPDRAQFVADLGGAHVNDLTPLPEVDTITNALFQEYLFVRGDPAGTELPPVRPDAYLGALATGAALIEDPQARARTMERLEAEGWRWHGARGRVWLARQAVVLRFFARRPGAFARRALGLWRRTPPGHALLRRSVARGATPPPGIWLEFPDRAAAVQRARGAPPRRARDLAHVPNLVVPARAARELTPPRATTPPPD